MSKPTRRAIRVLLTEARLALGMSQRGFGEALGWSKRTAARWDAGQSTPSLDSVRTAVGLLGPVHPELAMELAAWANDHFQSGEFWPHVEVTPAAPPGRTVAVQHAVDLVVLAAVEHSGVLPATVRPLLYGALKRARELNLTMAELEESLRPPVKGAEPGS